LSDDPGGSLRNLNAFSNTYANIIERIGSSQDVARSMLRHKAKQIVNDLITSVYPGININRMLINANSSILHLEALSRLVQRIEYGNYIEFMQIYINDIRQIRNKLRLEWRCDIINEDILRVGSIFVLILYELVDNAIDALHEDGAIIVEASTLTSAGVVQIRVMDTGVGIHESILPYIFDEGFSTKGVGRGLWLALVRSAARRFGGDVYCEIREGTIFSVILPLTA
jgi:signal transduction histidine kinase